MICEMSFIAIIFFPRVRQLLALGGIMFHSMIYMFMNISFFTLVAMYVVFFNWAALFHKLGRWLFKDDMFVLYDGNCGICRRTVATLRAFDLFGRITCVNALDPQTIDRHHLHRFEQRALIDMHAVRGATHWIGFAAYRAIAWRVPLLWLVLPWLYLQPIAKIGQRVYRRVADSRVCRLPRAAIQPVTARSQRLPLSIYATIAVGGFLVAGNMFFGAMQVEAGWPLACYPRFNGLRGPTIDSLQVVALTPTGQRIPLSNEIIQSDFAPEQFVAVVKRLLRTDDQAVLEQRFRALWSVWADEEPALRQASKVQFYKVNIALNPDQPQAAPLHSDLLMDLDL
jgi:predicted DCC family thiol-disulfide oxidoreductase YuxK